MSTGGSGFTPVSIFIDRPLVSAQKNPACSSTMMAIAQPRGEDQLCSDGKLLIVVTVIDVFSRV